MISHLDTSQAKRGPWSITGAAGYYTIHVDEATGIPLYVFVGEADQPTAFQGIPIDPGCTSPSIYVGQKDHLWILPAAGSGAEWRAAVVSSGSPHIGGAWPPRTQGSTEKGASWVLPEDGHALYVIPSVRGMLRGASLKAPASNVLPVFFGTHSVAQDESKVWWPILSTPEEAEAGHGHYARADRLDPGDREHLYEGWRGGCFVWTMPYNARVIGPQMCHTRKGAIDWQ